MAAHAKATEAGRIYDYRCHAGLHCFAVPIEVNKRQLVILGGRAFTSVAEYTQFLRSYGDLDAIRSGEGLRGVKFADRREVREAADLLASTAEYHFQSLSRAENTAAASSEAAPDLLDAHLEIIRLSDQLETMNRSVSQFYEFLRGVASSLDSHKVYPAVLESFSKIMRAGRSSLMILNDEADELALEAAIGYQPESEGPVRVKLGEGIAGSVMSSGSALLVRDAESDPRVPSVRRGRYKSSSFISFPITIGARKVGVINVTDRIDGSAYDREDLNLLEMMNAQLGLIIDRTEWHRKAEAYQQMSLTDPLTALPNRRYLEDRLFEEVERSKRHGTPLSFVIIDVDRFKTFNDIYGHTNADCVLVKTAQILRRSIRTIDMSARFGGDEFCMVLPETDIEAAARIAERLRQSVSETEFRSEVGEFMGKVTISVGVSDFNGSRQSPLAIIETADRALYQAKMRGRNCVAVYQDVMAAGKQPPPA